MASGAQAVERLARLVGWGGVGDDTVDWSAVSAAYGRPLPNDYHAFVRRFPSGVFQTFISVSHPGGQDPNSIPDDIEEILDMLRYARAQRPDFAFSVHPDPGGLIPWGYIGVDFVLCWLPDTPDPNMWHTIITTPSLSESHRCNAGMVDCLTILITGSGDFPSLRYVSERDPIFAPFTA
jgi:hypothetical protein